MSSAQRNGTATAYPRLIGSTPYTSPAGRGYRLEHWAILEAIRRWYPRGPGGLYAADGGFIAPTIKGAAGCGSADLAKELIGLLEGGVPVGAREDGSPMAIPARSASACVLAFRPYPDARYAIEDHTDLNMARWMVRHEGRLLRADEIAAQWSCHGLAAFPDPHAAQEAVLAMLAARRQGPRLAARLRAWADAVERGELAAVAGTADAAGAWTVGFRRGGPPP
jgi:hypothetical protein